MTAGLPPDAASSGPLIHTTQVQVAVPSPESQESIAIRMHDWGRLKRDVDHLGRPLQALRMWASVLLGVAASGLLGCLSLMPIERPGYVVPAAYIAVTVSAGLLGTILWRLDRDLARDEHEDVQRVRADMERLEEMCRGRTP